MVRGNQVHRRVHDFAERIRGVIDQLDAVQKQQLLRLLIEEVRVTGWHVEIRLRIALDQPPPPDPQEPDRSPDPNEPPSPPRRLSSEDGLRSVGGDDVGVVDEPVDHGGGDDFVAEHFAPAAEGLVGGDDEAGALVAAGDELEEQVRCLGFERDVADLVDLCGYPHRSIYADTATMPRRRPGLVRSDAVAGSGSRHSYRLSRNASVLSAGR